MHKPTFDGLKPEHQKAVREAMFAAVAYQRALAERQNTEALGKLIKGGMKYDELSKEELAKFREAVRPVYDSIRQRIGERPSTSP
jgi:TRAP-type C4-dicarboxylate transport system substrate-binding protein